MIPQRYYGLHFVPGVAEYAEKDGSHRVFLNESTIKKMDASFGGRPVFVKHKNDVDISKVQEADGIVVKSFYNKADGKTWAEFIIFTDAAADAIRNGWRLSNCYFPKSYAQGGLWNGVEYQKEVVEGEYEHLALVQNPRYDESIVLTPEKFKSYCEQKELEIKRLSNSKENKSMFDFFKKTKMENSADLENTVVILPKSKVEKTITQLINEADAIQNMQGYANMDHMVKVGEDEMSVKKMADSYCKMKSSMDEMEAKKNADLDGGEKDGEKDKKKADKTENKKKNADLDGGEKEEMKDKKKADKTENEIKEEKEKFEALKNAHLLPIKDVATLNLDRVERGKARYGSN